MSHQIWFDLFEGWIRLKQLLGSKYKKFLINKSLNAIFETFRFNTQAFFELGKHFFASKIFEKNDHLTF